MALKRKNDQIKETRNSQRRALTDRAVFLSSESKFPKRHSDIIQYALIVIVSCFWGTTV